MIKTLLGGRGGTAPAPAAYGHEYNFDSLFKMAKKGSVGCPLRKF